MMSLESYDVALRDKLKAVYPHVVFSPMSRVLENSAEDVVQSQTSDGSVEVKTKKDQKVALPMIAFDRINNPFNFEFAANDPAIRRGRFVHIEDDPYRERTFPVNIQYQIDVISDKRKEVDGIWRELVMFLYIKPIIEVSFDLKDGLYVEEFPLKLLDTDNTTDVEDFSEKGRLYRQTINVEVQQAKLFFDKQIPLIEEFPVRIIEFPEE